MLFSLLISGFESSVYAQNRPYIPYRKADAKVSNKNEVWNERKHYLFVGIDLGLNQYSEFSTAINEGSHSGFNGGLRGLFASYYDQWVWDAGLGYQRISSSGKNTNGSQFSVSSSGIYIDSSARYRLTRNWQLGPALDLWLNSDNGLNPNALSTTDNKAIFFGAQAIYEWMDDEQKLRFGGRLMTDLNVDGRTVNIYQIFFQFGFDSFGSSTERQPERPTEGLVKNDIERAESLNELPISYEPQMSEEGTAEVSDDDVLGDPIKMPTPTPIPTAAPVAVVPAKPAAQFVVSLKESSLPFATGSAKLSADSAQEVRETGKFLGKNTSQWKSLVVKGHTDIQGKAAFNLKLSKARAETVKKLLVAGGAPKNKIKAVGYGSKMPIDRGRSATAFAKNRRVELQFIGVKNAALINDGVVIGK